MAEHHEQGIGSDPIELDADLHGQGVADPEMNSSEQAQEVYDEAREQFRQGWETRQQTIDQAREACMQAIQRASEKYRSTRQVNQETCDDSVKICRTEDEANKIINAFALATDRAWGGLRVGRRGGSGGLQAGSCSG